MRFYTHHHQFYCGIDLHARAMYLCITDAAGTVASAAGGVDPFIVPDLRVALDRHALDGLILLLIAFCWCYHTVYSTSLFLQLLTNYFISIERMKPGII